jgi:hypothetical protein
MHQSPRIKPTLINGGYATPKAVENRRAKAAAKWDQARSVDLGWGRPALPYARWAPPLGGYPLMSSRVFLSWSQFIIRYFPVVLHISLPFLDNPLQKHRFTKTIEFYQYKP